MEQESQRGIRIALVIGAVRPGNYTSKAAALVIDELRQQEGIQLDVINPAELTLPPPGMGSDAPDAEHMQSIVAAATGVIFTTPEYHGGFSSVVKLVIENLGFPSVLAGKPIALLGVAAGQIGAIKSLEGLRSICSHVGATVLPGPVSVAGVQGVFDEEGNCNDPGVEKRVRGVATALLDYIKGHICPRIALENMVREAAEA